MENKFNSFLAKYLNQFVEKVDTSNLNQCFDLAIAWCEWLGLPISIFSGLMYAYQIYTNPTQGEKDNFDFIQNTPTGVPQKGDMVVWSVKYGSAGHVAIATGEGDVTKFKAFSQNDPTGSKCIIKEYGYTAVIGWLRYNKPIIEAQTEDWRAKYEEKCLLETTLRNAISDKDKLISSYDQQIKQLSANSTTLQTNYNSLALQLTTCQNDCKTYKEGFDQVQSLKDQIGQLEKTKQAMIDAGQEQQKKLNALQTKYDNVRKPFKDILAAIFDKLNECIKT